VLRRRVLFFAILAVAALPEACSDRIKIGQNLQPADGGAGGLSGAPANTAGAPPAASGGDSSCQITTCQGKVYLCGNCVDDDSDGLTDSADPECTGPCDNTEDSYFGGIPGQNNAPCHSDCYFDQDTGAGNDQCYWSQVCDPLSMAPSYPPSGDKRCAYDAAADIPGTTASCAELAATQSATCASYCGPLTPNGCDAFGCCELPAGSGKFVWLGSADGNAGTCDQNAVGDETACRPCTQVAATVNPCSPCEVCVGRTTPLPGANCASALDRCPRGQRSCGQLGEPTCETGQYCITGCCEAAPK
jgi:hypothetical protein